MKKLGIIVPYRNRPEHLEEFKRRFTHYLDRFKDIPYELIIVNQDNAKLFNRGMLLNIGFKYADKMMCDYVVFHDVDMIPVHVDYSYSDIPLHLATGFRETGEKESFDEYFGGVTMFPTETFKEINGYSNKYWGWGYEDTDLLERCKKFEVKLDSLNIKNMRGSGKTIKFNGVNAYVKGKNIFNFNHDTSIFISFYPEKLTCDHNKEVDEYSIFSIPGYDFSISYNSFSRYSFCTFDNEKNVLYINSKIKTNYKTNLCVTIDSYGKEILVYQDGEFIGKINSYNKLYSYNKEPFFYLGVGNPERLDNPKYFKGYLDSFIVFSKILTIEEIKELSEYTFGKYPSSEHIKLHYDAKIISGYKLVDLSGNGNDGMITNCELSIEEIDDYKIIKVPYRRESVFTLLSHEENGFFQNKWKTEATRWNQLRFYNEVMANQRLLGGEGLRNVKFVEYGREKNKNVMQINVGI